MKKLGILIAFALLMAVLPTFVPQPTYAMTGSGTSGDPYVIYNVTDLQNMSLDTTAYYILGNDIDASATSTWNWDAGRGVYEGFVPITTFAGHFDGNCSTISNLYENWDSRNSAGLFGGLGDDATVQNVSVLAANITLTYSSASATPGAGVLVGMAYSKYDWLISQCEVSGYVHLSYTDTDIYAGGHTHAAAGGLIGYVNYGSGGVIEECGANVDVVCLGYGGAVANAGGFVGSTASHVIRNSYARGDALAYCPSYSDCSGGFVARHASGTLDNCYSTGSAEKGFSGLGTCTDCFWDTQTSGTGSSTCGTGKTTAEMKTQSTFTGAGWDFTTIWDIGGTMNDGYPYLLWWYNPPALISDVNQVVWFQPNAIIEGTELPNRAQSGTLIDGEIHWGANPAGITMSHGELIPEEEYEFAPITPSSEDIIKPAPESMTTDVDTAGLVNNPLYPMVAALGALPGLNERLVWLGLAWLIVIGAMLLVHLGFDTKKGTQKPQHFVLTTIVGLGLSIFFYVIGIFPLWVIIVMAFGLVGAIIWERQPVL